VKGKGRGRRGYSYVEYEGKGCSFVAHTGKGGRGGLFRGNHERGFACRPSYLSPQKFEFPALLGTATGQV